MASRRCRQAETDYERDEGRAQDFRAVELLRRGLAPSLVIERVAPLAPWRDRETLRRRVDRLAREVRMERGRS